MALGLLLTAVALVWLSTRPEMSTKARMLASHNARPLPKTESTEHNSNELQITSNKQPDTRFHIVRQSETLSDISYRYYGSANKWQKILDANRSVVKNANKLTPGLKLTIPQ